MASSNLNKRVPLSAISPNHRSAGMLYMVSGQPHHLKMYGKARKHSVHDTRKCETLIEPALPEAPLGESRAPPVKFILQQHIRWHFFVLRNENG